MKIKDLLEYIIIAGVPDNWISQKIFDILHHNGKDIDKINIAGQDFFVKYYKDPKSNDHIYGLLNDTEFAAIAALYELKDTKFNDLFVLDKFQRDQNIKGAGSLLIQLILKSGIKLASGTEATPDGDIFWKRACKDTRFGIVKILDLKLNELYSLDHIGQTLSDGTILISPDKDKGMISVDKDGKQLSRIHANPNFRFYYVLGL